MRSRYTLHMESHQVGNSYLLRIARGEEIVESVTQFLKEKNIRSGSLSGIGAASDVTLRYYSLEDKKYHSKEFSGEFEIASLNGNISILDGEIWPHIHIVLSDTDYHCFGGHLEKAIVGVTCEIVISPLEGEVVRTFDKETGLKLWSLG
jgi:uncharacterized protein